MDVVKLFNQAQKVPFGKRIFSFFTCLRAPYFFSIRPYIVELKEGKAVAQMTERRSIRNHINTIHVIATCNLCEVAMGLVAMATIPENLRWIPVGMNVEYKKISKGTLTAIAEVKKSDFKVGNTDVIVHVYDQKNVNVVSATITLNIKEQKNGK